MKIDEKLEAGRHRKWAEFRLSVIGHLLACPPPRGELRGLLRQLAEKIWQHPIDGSDVTFSAGTLERWYYLSRDEENPIDALATKLRSDSGGRMIKGTAFEKALISQYNDHPSWNRSLHHKNLRVLADRRPELKPVPSYSTLKRYMAERGLVRIKKKRSHDRDGYKQSRSRFSQKESRLYEVEHSGVLWHLDAHTCKTRQVLDSDGKWISPVAIATIDDYSRLACHLQWYCIENTQYIVHSFLQAVQKRGLPWRLMSDNGKAMTASEFIQGLTRLSISHDLTLPYTPEQNAKLERYWGTVEGQLIAMLENKKDLTLHQLNDATHAWLEMGYNREFHEEIRCAPVDRFCKNDNRHRKCPDSATLSLVFTRQITRKPRRFDASITIDGVRFAIPWQYRHMKRLIIRYRSWDLSTAWLMDQHGDRAISRILPVNLAENSSGHRKSVENDPGMETDEPSDEIAPLLAKMMEEYAATGLPPAWLPTENNRNDKNEA